MEVKLLRCRKVGALPGLGGIAWRLWLSPSRKSSNRAGASLYEPSRTHAGAARGSCVRISTWRHLRTTNPIESSFATVKLRTRVTKGAGSKTAALALAYKLLDAAQERWRRINGHELVADVLDGITFKDGVKVEKVSNEEEIEKVAA